MDSILSVQDLKLLLRSKFKRIWRCADSGMWDLMRQQGLLSFNWLDSTLDYSKMDKAQIGAGKNAIYPFAHALREGDLVFVMGKNKFYGIGIAKSSYRFGGPDLILTDSTKRPAVTMDYFFGLTIGVDHNFSTHNNPVTFADIDKYKFSLQNTLTFLQSFYPEGYDKLSQLVNNGTISVEVKEEKLMQKPEVPLNQILYGPPGTGKTHHTVNKALQIIRGYSDAEIKTRPRADLKAEFDALMNEGQIVFSTFHQSMTYEDFVEGIRPVLDVEKEEDKFNKEDDQIKYRFAPGVFKGLCIESSFEVAKVGISQETQAALDFPNLYDMFIEEVEESLLQGKKFSLDAKLSGTILIDSISSKRNILVKHSLEGITYTVSKSRLTKLNSAIADLDQVSNIKNRFKEVIGGNNYSAYWAVLNAIRQIKGRVETKIEANTYEYPDKVEVVAQMTKDDYRNSSAKKFVLIIDEINRGNVSQIFGELITLLEADKRLGRDEALEVTLPYSKEKFGVPANLYIIGTMNTADRSVEALDTALRRRFSFTEMPPNYELKELEYSFADTTGKEILKTINQRIEKLLDRDHLIGHSYLMVKPDEKAEDKLPDSFYRNIIPLLQEYFYGDYAKIGAVLGKGFIDKKADADKIEFADFDYFEAADFADKVIYEIIDHRSAEAPAESFEQAIRTLMISKK
ncbi:MAG: AAA family ATPase [Bacteroidia bacterium]